MSPYKYHYLYDKVLILIYIGGLLLVGLFGTKTPKTVTDTEFSWKDKKI